MTAAFVRNAGTTAPENTAGKEPRKFPGAMATCLGLCALNLVLQLAWHRGALGDGILSSRHPASADALEYARAAGTLARGFGEAGLAGFARAFGEAFGDGWRMPGYPLFLALFQGADAPWRAARLAQILLTVPLGAIVFIILRSARARPLAALVGGLLAALWLPLYHYSPALLAEAPSLALMGALLAALAARKPTLAGTLVAALAYLKPNHLLLLLPVALFLLADAGDGTRPLSPSLRARLARVLIAAAVTAALVAPWSLYLSRRHDGFVPLTLNGGYNLLLGTGRIAQGDPEALPRRAAKALGLQATEDAGADPDGEPTARAAAWSAEARRLWAERPFALSLHGGAKVLHAFGFSLRGGRDALLASFTIAAVLAGAWLWRRGKRSARPWVLFAAGCALAVAAQAFAYLPNQRLKTVMFDPAALVVIGLALSSLARVREAGSSAHSAIHS